MAQPKPRPGGKDSCSCEKDKDNVDIEALTAAVERLLRRELEIERERLRPGRRY